MSPYRPLPPEHQPERLRINVDGEVFVAEGLTELVRELRRAGYAVGVTASGAASTTLTFTFEHDRPVVVSGAVLGVSGAT